MSVFHSFVKLKMTCCFLCVRNNNIYFTHVRDDVKHLEFKALALIPSTFVVNHRLSLDNGFPVYLLLDMDPSGSHAQCVLTGAILVLSHIQMLSNVMSLKHKEICM